MPERPTMAVVGDVASTLMGLSQRGRRILMTGLATVGCLFLGRVLVLEGIQGLGGSGGIDAIAYWTAAGHAWRAEPLYEVGGFGFGVYQYPPVFAHLLAPASLFPVGAFVWLWRGIEMGLGLDSEGGRVQGA